MNVISQTLEGPVVLTRRRLTRCGVWFFRTIGSIECPPDAGQKGIRQMNPRMQRTTCPTPRALILARRALLVAGMALVGLPAASRAQEALPPIPDADLRGYAEAFLEIKDAREEFQNELGRTHDENGQTRLRAEFAATVATLLEAHDLTSERYDEITTIISHDHDHRVRFDAVVARIEEERGG